MKQSFTGEPDNTTVQPTLIPVQPVPEYPTAPILPPIINIINVSQPLPQFDVRPEVKDFAYAMEAELVENDHKGHWRDAPIEQLLDHLEDEVKELKAAIKLQMHPDEVLSEAADLANLAMMVADNYRSDYDS